MKNIKNFNDFEPSNEEVSLKNILGSAAIAAGLALGSPNSAKASEPTKTEMTSSYGGDISAVIKVDSTMKKEDIYKSLISSLRNSGARISTSTQDRIDCSVIMSASPKRSNGQTTANMTILIKDGRFKVEFSNVRFAYGYQQPTVADQVGRNVKNTARQVLIQKVGQSIPNRQLSNIVTGALNTATMQQQQQNQMQNKNFTLEEAKAKGMDDYVDSVNSEMSGIIRKLESSVKNNNTSTNEDW
jgi:hypothetical protein